MECPCIHYWVIEIANGNPNGSTGKCKKCNITQVFYNSIPLTKQLFHDKSKDKEKN